MKKVILLLCIVLFVLLPCCNVLTDASVQPKNQETISDKASDHQDPTLENANTYEVDYYLHSDYENVKIPYMVSETKDCDEVNSLIYDEINLWISNLPEDSSVNVNFSVTLQSGEVLSLLFEGWVSNATAAHPTSEAFSITVDLESLKIIDPMDFIEINDDLVSGIRDEINLSNNSLYSDELWVAIQDYINGQTDDKLKDVNNYAAFALSDEGIWVCMYVPHAIGDYVKLLIQSGWKIRGRVDFAQSQSQSQSGDGSMIDNT